MKNKISNKISISQLLVIFGSILRIIYGFKSNLNIMQHDVLVEGGHFHYACHVFSTNSLPLSKYGQFYQPPLNAIMQSICMRIISLFIRPSDSIKAIYESYIAGNYKLIFDNAVLEKYMLRLYESCRVLSIIYSILILIIIYFILKEFDLKKRVERLIVFICAFYPGMIYMAGQYNNDPLSYVFFFLSILLAIRWCKNERMIIIILLAISIGIGMLTKLSVGLIAFLIAPMMIIKIIMAIKGSIKDRPLQILFQIVSFGIIVFPLGLAYPIRNLILLEQPLGYVRGITEASDLYTGSKDIIDRMLSFPIDRLVTKKYNIFHDYNEYNIWIDLLKTSTFEEYKYASSVYYFAQLFMLFSNIVFYILGILSFILAFLKKCVDKNLLNICIILTIIALASYVSFNINYPASCTSHYRYIMYITFALSVLISNLLENFNNKSIKAFTYTVFTIMAISTTIFVMLWS